MGAEMSQSAYSVAQAAKALELSQSKIRTMLKSGELPFFRLGTLYRIRADVIRAERAKRRGMIYFVATSPPKGKKIKIGFTTNLKSRLDSLRTGSPVKLALVFTHPGTQQDERALHKRFAEHRMEGEWFWWCTAIEDYINEQSDRLGALPRRRQHNPWDEP